MARSTATNYTTQPFTYATAATDLFKKEDVEVLAQAVDQHDHSSGKGLTVYLGAAAPGSLSGSALADGSVTTNKLAGSSVDSTKLASNAVQTAHITDGAVTTPKIGDQQVSLAKLAPGAVGRAQIIDGEVITSKIAASVGLTTPAITGIATWTTPQNLPQLSKESGQIIAALAANALDWVVDYGATGLVSVPNGGLANQSYNFNRAFAAAPFVLVSVGFFSGTLGSVHQVGVISHNVTTSGFQLDFGNGSGGTQSIIASWIAIGR